MDTNLYREKLIALYKEFERVCDLLNLRYFVGYGTLLGAVRHKGFIPWDDDLDVIMPRPDYDTFMEKAQGILKNEIFLQNIYTEKNYILNFSKLRDTNTTLVETEYKSYDLHHGVFIDIFPIDGYIKGQDKMLDFRIKERAFEEPTGIKRIYSSIVSGNQAIMTKIGPAVASRVNMKNKLIKMDEKAKRWNFDMCDTVADIVSSIYIVPMEKTVFEKSVDLYFEGHKVKAPVGYDRYLTLMYGDYMKLPPEDKRKPHHNFAFLDLEKSYREYTFEDRKGLINWKRIKKMKKMEKLKTL